jgi:hypothetical protein
MHIVVVARNALSLGAQHTATFKPLPHAVEDDNLVPEGSFCDNGRHVFGAKRKLGHFV